jgi:hypothetical protein
MERRVLSMPRGPSAGITTIRCTELELPRERSFVFGHGSKSLVFSDSQSKFRKKEKPECGIARIGEPLFEREEKQSRWLQPLPMVGVKGPAKEGQES